MYTTLLWVLLIGGAAWYLCMNIILQVLYQQGQRRMLRDYLNGDVDWSRMGKPRTVGRWERRAWVFLRWSTAAFMGLVIVTALAGIR